MSVGIYSLKLVGRDGEGNEWNNVLHYNVVGSDAVPPIFTAQRLITAWNLAHQSSFLACIPTTVVLRFVASRRELGGPTALNFYPYIPGTRPGVSSTIVTGPQISYFSDSSTRVVGKTFLPGIANGDVQDGVMSDDLVAAVQSFSSDLLTDLTLLPGADTAALTIFHRGAVPTSYDVIAAEVRPKLGVQRRRILAVH